MRTGEEIREGTHLNEPSYGIAAVNKALDVLEALQDVEEMSLQEIAQRTGLPTSSCFRLLATLEARGYVGRGADEKRYRLTFQLVEISKRILRQNPVLRLAQPQMRLLWDRFGETVNLAVLSGADVLYIDTIESRFPFRVTETAGSRSPVYVTALGKAMAAYLPPPELESLIARQSFRMLTPRTLIDAERFREALHNVGRLGYALDDEEAEVGVRCVAAPILDQSGYPVAAISISAPATRLSINELEPVTRTLTEACRTVSAHLGRS